MEQSDRNYLFSKIKQLAAKRQKHQNIIQKLLENQEISTHRSPTASRISNIKIPESVSKASEKSDEQGNGENTYRSVASCSSSLSKQVNLEVYLITKPQNAGGQGSTEYFIQNHLQKDLRSLYGQQVECIIQPSEVMAKKSLMISQDLIDFGIISNFLQENDLWNEVFIKKQNEYYACICPEFNPHHLDLISLSKQKLTSKQISLIIDYYHPQINLASCAHLDSEKNLHQVQSICIGYLLLYRLLSHLGNGFAPDIMQSLFGYPYKIYNIQNTNQYIEFYELSNKFETQSFMLLGESLINHRLEEIHRENQFSVQKLINLYSKIIVIHLKQDLCCKSIDVIHRRNHHAVVDIENTDDVQIKVYMSFFSNKSGYNKKQKKFVSDFESKCSISHDFYEKNHENVLYRYSLMKQNGQIVKFSTSFQANKETVELNLAPNSQYKLYISEISPKIQNGSQDLCSFSIIIHSQLSLQNVSAQIKFNESYNTMTQNLINKYLRDFISIDEVEKQMIRLSEINPSSDLLIVRANLKLMGLVIDFISIKEQARRKMRKIYIQYQDKEVLCDKNYRENRKKLLIELPEIYQIHLSKKSKIKSCSGFKYSFAQILL